MSERERWTPAMMTAWQYALRGVERGLTATAGYRDYVAGGGAIRRQDWFMLSGLAREAQQTGDLVQGQPWETPIPDQAYTGIGWEYAHKYVATADLLYVDQDTGEQTRRTITVESDTPKTWDETEADIMETGARRCGGEGSGTIEITKVRFFSPTWAQE